MGLKRKRDWTKPLTKLELFNAIWDWKNVPLQVLEEVVEAEYLHKSPCSLSFYNKRKEWGSTEDKTIRWSNHWNFKSSRTGNKIHSKTDIPIYQDVWAKGIYDFCTDTFTILKIYENKKTSKAEIHSLYSKIFPNGNPLKPSEETINSLKSFAADVKEGKVQFKLNGSLKRVLKITRIEVHLEGDIILDRFIINKSDKRTFPNFTIKYPDFCIVYKEKEYTEQELYNNHFLHGKQATQEN